MGFLSGVLGAVKNTQTYNVGKSTLQNLVSNEIKKHLCSGHDGFKKLLPILTKEIEKYNKEVRESNEKVKKPIEELLKQVGDAFTEKVQNILSQERDYEDPEKVQAAEKQIKNMFRDEIATFKNTFNSAYKYTTKIEKTDMKIAIHYLNSTLQLRVKHGVSNVSHEIKRLERVADKESKALEETKKKISATLSTLTTGVDCKIDAHIQEFVTRVKERVNVILNELTKINSELLHHIDTLQDWITKAENVIKESLKKVDEILKEVKWDDPNKFPKKIEEATEYIKIYAGGLHRAGKTVTESIAGCVNAAKEKVNTLEEGLKDDLLTVRGAIKAKVTAVQGEIGKLHAVVEQGAASTVGEKTIAAVIKHIKDKVAGIKGRSGLQGVVDGVKQYAKKFGNDAGETDTFEGLVKNWIRVILSTNPVKGYVDQYIDTNKKKFKDRGIINRGGMGIPPDFEDRIADEILSMLKVGDTNIINDAGKMVASGVQQDVDNANQIQTYVTAIRTRCNKFAEGLGERLKSRQINYGQIAKRFEELPGLLDTPVDGPTYNTNLINAIRHTLYQLVGAARRTGDELQQFIAGSAIGTYLDQTLADVKQLDSYLQKSLGVNAHVRQDGVNYAGNVDEAIKQVTTTLDQQLPDDERGNVSLSGFDSFKPGGTRGTGKNRREQLDDAIAKIGSDVTVNLSSIDTFNDQVAQKITELTDKLNKLCNEIIKLAGPGSYRDGLQSKLTELRDTYFKDYSNGVRDAEKSINKIKQDLSDLQNTLHTDPIAKTKDLVGFLTKAETDVAKALKEKVNGDIKNAEDKLTTFARKQYVCAIKELFASFADKVKKELQSLLEPIDKDLIIGMKGFMTKMESHFVKYKNRLEDITKISKTSSPGTLSPASPAAYMFSDAYRTFVREVKTQTDFTSDFRKIKPSHDALTKLLDGLHASKHFNYKFEENLHELKNTFKSFNPSTFGESTTALSQCLKEGIRALLNELDKAYVNRYSGRVLDWTDATEQRNCAKLLFTIIFTLQEGVDRLRKECITGGRWSAKRLYENEKREENPLGKFLTRCGFQVAKDEDSKAGELKYPSYHFTGKSVYERLLEQGVAEPALIEHLSKCESNESKKPNDFNLFDLLSCVLHHVEKYSEVCHIPTRRKRRQPCNVYEMLVWCSGLTYNTVYQTMLDVTLTDSFVDPKKANAGDGPSATDISGASIEAYPANITYDALRQAVVDTCSVSYDLLCKVVGHGDAFATYGIDFCTNTANLYYPSSGDDCLQMLLEVTRRVFPPLKYLLQQCSLDAQCSGWRECQYGRDIMSSRQPCKDHANEGSMCSPTSPLMSYLSDTLPGHLPHHVTSIGCKSVCSNCPKGLPGMPCITPLGFRCYSGSTRTGKELCEVLTKLLGNKLTSSLSCLFPKPPSNLPEHFSFALSLANGWHSGVSNSKTHVIHNAFSSSIAKATINLHDRRSDFTDALRNAYGSTRDAHDDRNHNPISADLRSLSMSQSCTNHPCGPYLQSLSGDAYSLLAPKHAALYLSWATYLPWTFHNYLKSLLTEYQQIFCRDWGCRRCQRGDGCRPGHHGTFDSPCQCKSLVSCKGVSATLYKCGFAFGDAAALNEKTNARTCTKFGVLLKRVIDSKYFVALFKQCDELLFKIRAPFIWLNVALWLLSLLYLIHIVVIRLDLLHIKSHLHSPSSHRIAAQSLLAASRVNKLNRVFYLQP